MENYVETLDLSLLESKSKLEKIDYWCHVLNWPNGWHYDLDIIWILNKIESLKLKPGTTVLDVGAGLGVTQFILASLGYNVMSLDFQKRQVPRLTKNIFNIIDSQESDLAGYKSKYMEFMNFGQKKQSPLRFLKKSTLLDCVKHPPKTYYRLRKRILDRINLNYLLEKKRDHGHFGKVTFLRGTFNSIPLPDNSVDVLISISAFEHNEYEQMSSAVKEFERVVKVGGSLFVTTSLSKEKDWYFEPSKGWNLTFSSLKNWFGVENHRAVEFDTELEKIRHSKLLQKRVNPFYRFSGENGLPYGELNKATYIPVGISKKKSDSKEI